MARVIVTPRAVADLRYLIDGLGLPGNALARVQRSFRTLERFPLAGRELTGRWAGNRFLIGPWMILVYVHDADDDAAFVVAVEDGRSSSAATRSR